MGKDKKVDKDQPVVGLTDDDRKGILNEIIRGLESELYQHQLALKQLEVMDDPDDMDPAIRDETREGRLKEITRLDKRIGVMREEYNAF